jgi:uncharacterized small protein (DUF1192 family)
MTTIPPDWFKERIASATVLREVYAAAGLDACAAVMQEEIDRLNREYAKLLAQRAAAMMIERKQAPS